MFAQCLDRKEQSAGDVALGVFLLGTDIDDGQLVAKRVHQLQGFSRGERAGLREFGGGGVAYAANMKTQAKSTANHLERRECIATSRGMRLWAKCLCCFFI